MNSNFSKSLVSTLIIGFAGIAISGSDTNAQESVALEQSRICRAIENDQERLNCYDRIDIDIVIVNNEVPTAPIAPMARQEANNSAPASDGPDPETFGLQKPRENAENENKNSIQVTITSFTRNTYGKISFHTANGQIWRQTDGTRVSLKRGETFKATIKEGVFSGYRLKIEGKRSLIRVERVR